ncbi:hypothetical protein PDJAM_G00116650 [Pangasius djambal]|uniref:Uncharacterized protein n=1 Tax=Pangasius djambal TaxID=1691987 RepID=A0ACC5Z9C0_9TELE|nr:hypothetical protein [Pangasius djambal]
MPVSCLLQRNVFLLKQVMEDIAEASLRENRRFTLPASEGAHDLRLHLYREVSCSTFHLLFPCQQTS